MAQDLPLQQHPNFASALMRLGRRIDTVRVEGASPVLTIQRFGLRFASRGPVWETVSAAERALALRRAGLHVINSDGGDADVLRRAGFRRIMGPQRVAELSLAGAPADRLARMKGNWRNAFRRAQETPLRHQFEWFAPRRHSWLLTADLQHQKDKGFRSLPHSFLIAYAEANPKTVPVFVSYDKVTPVAAMLFLEHGSVATYHLGWTSPLGRKLRAHHALLGRASDRFARNGLTRMDLGTLDPETNPGLAKFKLGSGAVQRDLGGTWFRLPFL